MAMATVPPDLPGRLRAALESNGMMGDLKSQLRARLVATLRSPYPGSSAVGTCVREGQGERGEQNAAANLYVDLGQALVGDFLRANGFDYTLSVFDSEARLVPQVQSVNQLAVQLDLPPSSRLLGFLRQLCGEASVAGIGGGQHGLLASLLQAVAKICGGVAGGLATEAAAAADTESSAVTTTPSLERLSQQLEAVEMEFAGRLSEEARAGAVTMEERILAYVHSAPMLILLYLESFLWLSCLVRLTSGAPGTSARLRVGRRRRCSGRWSGSARPS